ncbi:diguanylate cyclase [Rhodanobacter sp. Col0626]|uniref:GGDEF domain-containing protein n=1 Tax=Rhodanobacter sp. Col0626 TaxID=3415679 RepID=UPI003CEA0D79
MKMYAGISRAYVPLLLAQLGVIAWAPLHLLSWSYAVVLAMLALTVLLCWRRRCVSVAHNRPLWSLLLLALVAQGCAFGLLFTDSLSNPQGTLVAFDPTLYFCLSSLLLTIAAAYNPVATLYRWASIVDALLACAIATLFYYTLHQVLNAATQESATATFVMRMFDAMGLFVAVFATLRLVSTKRSDERRFFFVLTVFAWLDAVLPGIHNRFILSSESYLPELLLGLPFVVLGFLLGRRRKVWLRSYRPSRRIRHFAESISPFVMSLALCCLAFAQLGKNPFLATIMLILAITSYAARNAIVLGQHLAFEDDLRKLKRGLQQAIVRDDLSSLLNRRGFYRLLRREWAGALETGRALSVAMIDIDSFKAFNDTYGHLAGDDCLVAVAHALQREASQQPDVVVARYGGEEFVALMGGYDPATSEDILQRLRRRVEAMQIRHARSIKDVVTISAGLASTATARYPDSDKFLNAADGALYVAKRNGRNCIHRAGDTG